MPIDGERPITFESAAKAAGAISQVPLGVRPIRVKRIVGSAGKAEKLGPDFLPLGPGPAAGNYRAILKRMKEGEVLPPITVYQLGSRYFVIDGHTRVAAAKQLGTEFLDADVIEVLPRKEGEINLTYYARKEFERYTGLEGVRLTAPWRYHLLHHHIEGYRRYLEGSMGRDVPLTEAARIWNRSQYLPTLQAIRDRKLGSSTGGRTTGDVYTDILRSWAEEQGLAVSLREMLDKYDDRSREGEGTFAKARRTVAEVVDATLPRVLPSRAANRRERFADRDVDSGARSWIGLLNLGLVIRGLVHVLITRQCRLGEKAERDPHKHRGNERPHLPSSFRHPGRATGEARSPRRQIPRNAVDGKRSAASGTILRPVQRTLHHAGRRSAA